MSKPDYKSTLHLPTTSFPMRARLPDNEPKQIDYWRHIHLVSRLQERQSPKSFVLHDGPIYANGDIHIGHALNRILKDIMNKVHVLQGESVYYVPGWDCHGLPIEWRNEKKHGKPGDRLTRDQFRHICRQDAAEQMRKQRQSFERLGVLADWDHRYATMDYSYEAAILRSLACIIEQGHLVQGYKPVHWCTRCVSALAEAEVEYMDKTSCAVDVAFPIINRDVLSLPSELMAFPWSIPIWTTTPWTLPANQAVAVHPEHTYVAVKMSRCGQTSVILIAQTLLASTMERYAVTDYEVVSSFQGSDWASLMVKHPCWDREVPVVMGEHVTVDAGTGAVHTAPAHGEDDYRLGMLYNLPIESPVLGDGCFDDSLPELSGQSLKKAESTLLELLRQRGVLLHHTPFQHSYPHCWRHKTPLIFRATPQWFISMDDSGLRQKALEAIDRVHWSPTWAQKRMQAMLIDRPDWCISRQNRAWGMPMGLLVHRKTGQLHPRMPQLLEQLADEVAKGGLEVWDTLTVEQWVQDPNEAQQYEKVTDTLDVWFDSGVSHTAVLKARDHLSYPADLYIEGSDQYRGWFQSSLLTALAMHGQAPYRAVISHGFTVDAHGHKMSKSLGNTISPDQVIKQYGADILRLTVAASDYRDEISLSDDIFKRLAELYRRIRNTTRYLLSNLHDFEREKHDVAVEDLMALDNWLLERARTIQNKIQKDYEQAQFHRVVHTIHQFCAVDLGGFYLDVIKDRQYTLAADSLARRSAQTVMYHTLEVLVRWMAPILSFTAEEVWQHLNHLGRPLSVFLAEWYTLPKPLEQPVVTQKVWEHVLLVRDAVNVRLEEARVARHIRSGLDAVVTLYADEPLYTSLMTLQPELKFVLLVSQVHILFEHEHPKQRQETSVPGLWVEVVCSPHEKCARCWHKSSDVGENTAHPALCARCISNIEGPGEIRRYA